MKTVLALLIAIFFSAEGFVLSQQTTSNSGDWNQILGPIRNGSTMTDKTPGWDETPEVLWQKEIGEGFAGPIVHQNHVYLFHRPSGASRKFLVLEKLVAEDGESVWKQDIATAYRGEMDGDYGPKATPVIDQDSIYCYGPDGKLSCLRIEDGSIVWEVDAREKYRATRGYFGCGSSPIVIGDHVLVNVGGRRSASVVAFEKATGKEVWKVIDDEASYSSPIAVEFDGRKIAIFLTRTRFVGLDPKDGSIIFSNEFGQKGPKAVASMPVAFGSKLFANAAYGVGAVVLDLKNAKGDGSPIEPDWSSRTAFGSHYGTPVFRDGYLYGVTGREDMRNGSFRCIEAETGKVKWDQPSFPVGHTLAFKDRMLVLDHQGKLHIVRFSAEGFESLQSTVVFDGPTRAIPAYSNGRLFFRSNARRGSAKLVAIKVTQD